MTENSNSQDTSTADALAGASEFPVIQGGRYTYKKVIGSGGAGTIFLAHDAMLNKDVAIKKLHDGPQTQAIRFQREARLVAALKHENVMSALDFGITEKNEPYLVLDYVEGESLRKLLKRTGRVPATEALEIFIQTAKGLAHAHKNQILHRDIKPSNVMLVYEKNRDEKVVRVAKIVDFGLAKDTLDEQSLTLDGVGFGTPLYMSPEQSQGRDVDERSDIYSFGCLMYEVLTGKPPFCGQTNFETTRLHATEPVPKIPGDCDCSETMESIVAKCLRKHPDERYQTFYDLLVQLYDERDSAKMQERTKSAEEQTSADGFFVPLRTQQSGKRTWLVWAPLVVLCVVLIGYQFKYGLIPKNEHEVTSKELKRSVEITHMDNLPRFDPVFSPCHSLKMLFYRTPETLYTSFAAEGATDEDLARWLKDADPKIEQLYLGDAKLTDKGFKLLEERKLKVLVVVDTALTNDMLRSIGRLNLAGLALRRTKSVDIKELVATLKNLPGIRRLELTYIQIDDEVFAAINKLKGLNVLYLEGCTGITRKGMDNLRSLKDLNELLLNRADVTGDALVALDEMTEIRRIGLAEMKLDDQVLNKISALKDLKGLNLGGCTGITRDGIKSLRALKHLDTLSLNGTQITDDTLADLTKTPVETLFLQRTSVTDKSLPRLYGWPRLMHLDVTNTLVTDEGISRFKQYAVNGKSKSMKLSWGKQLKPPPGTSIQERYGQ